MTAQKVQDVAADQFRKNDKFTMKKSPQISQISEADKTRLEMCHGDSWNTEEYPKGIPEV